MKNILCEINDRLNIAEEMIIELEDIAIKTIQLKQRKMGGKNPKCISEHLL